jgi:hypothetical protein
MIYSSSRAKRYPYSYEKWLNPTPMMKRDYGSILMVACVLILLICIALDASMYEKRYILYLCCALALVNAAYLQWQNYCDRKAVSSPRKNLSASFYQ